MNVLILIQSMPFCSDANQVVVIMASKFSSNIKHVDRCWHTLFGEPQDHRISQSSKHKSSHSSKNIHIFSQTPMKIHNSSQWSTIKHSFSQPQKKIHNFSQRSKIMHTFHNDRKYCTLFTTIENIAHFSQRSKIMHTFHNDRK